MTAKVPREVAHRSSWGLAFSATSPPAEPVATVLASADPICMVAQPDNLAVVPEEFAVEENRARRVS
ncbi:MAG: hypothetical protein ABTR27_01745, partial [Candidatus Competibacter phosphatis]